MENNQHPVLTAYRERIAELEARLTKLQADYELLDTRYAREVRATQDKDTYLNETLMNALENEYDRDTIFYIANELDVSLTQMKTFVVQAEFQVEVILPVDETFDADDLDFTLSHDYLNDYTFTGIVSSDEN
jgi:hypothetical protein